MIQGTKITLTPALPCHKQAVYEWCFHSETTKCHSGPPDYPEAPIAAPEEFFRENSDESEENFMSRLLASFASFFAYWCLSG